MIYSLRQETGDYPCNESIGYSEACNAISLCWCLNCRFTLGETIHCTLFNEN